MAPCTPIPLDCLAVARYAQVVALATAASPAASLCSEVLDPFRFDPNPGELMRSLGYHGPKAKDRCLPKEIERILDRGQEYLRPRATYSVYEVLRRGGPEIAFAHASIHGKVASFLERAERVAAFVVTVGSEITEQARAASERGDVMAAWALDALGSYGAEATAHSLFQYLQQRMGGPGSISPRYSPGYCGMRLTEQTALFQLVSAREIGVSLTESLLMQPLKSVSGLLGISPEGSFGTLTSPCEHCELVTCAMRR
ncbi:MAG: vitamin B12 dependent-methionine synthase activation domain-containing protein [Myxococcales bacterium]